jgi:hypothetical protein
MRKVAVSLLSLLSVAAAYACGADGSADTSDDPTAPCAGASCHPKKDGGAPVSDVDGGVTDATIHGPFVAIGSDFEGYATWPSFFLGDHDAGDTVHLPGPRTVYINKMPPKGATEFPIGTILVKIVQNGPKENWQVFGMVKRGGSFNPLGAIDWEWFGLSVFDSGAVKIEWRGATPPADAGYSGGGSGGACNFCHAGGGGDNDFVLSPPLNLATL